MRRIIILFLMLITCISFVNANGGAAAVIIIQQQEADEYDSINALGLGPVDYAIENNCKLFHERGKPLNEFYCGDKSLIVNSDNEIVSIGKKKNNIQSNLYGILSIMISMVIIAAFIGFIINYIKEKK